MSHHFETQPRDAKGRWAEVAGLEVIFDADDSNQNNLNNFLIDLIENNLLYGAEQNGADATFVTQNDYGGIIEEVRNKERFKKGISADAFIEKYRERYAEAAVRKK